MIFQKAKPRTSVYALQIGLAAMDFPACSKESGHPGDHDRPPGPPLVFPYLDQPLTLVRKRFALLLAFQGSNFFFRRTGKAIELEYQPFITRSKAEVSRHFQVWCEIAWKQLIKFSQYIRGLQFHRK